MTKTFDEKREAFDRLFAPRLEKAVKAVSLLGNLNRKADYAWTNVELQTMTDQLDDAVDGVLEAFGIAPAAGEEEPVAPPEGGAVELDQRSEVRWALDAMQRGDTRLAKDRLNRVVAAWIEEEKNR